jgi:CPA1 family monovalent cation:H+ antiporter
VRTISLLAVPGVLVSTLLTGLLLYLGLGISPVEALLFGVLISPTDPIAVTALFKQLGIDNRSPSYPTTSLPLCQNLPLESA